MNIVLLISADRGRRCLESLYQCITDNDQVTIFTFLEKPWEPLYVDDIKKLANLYNSQVYVTSKVNEPSYSQFWESEIDVIIAIGWRYLLPSKIYNTASIGCFVFHDSYLPKNRGFSPTVWSIRNGERNTGVSVFKVTERVDEGPIIFQEEVSIFDNDYISEVMEKVTISCESLIKKLYQSIKTNTISLKNQNHNNASYLCKLVPNDFQIDWKKTSKEIFDLIRSYSYPYPGAFTFFQNKKLYIYSASVESIPFDSENIEGRVNYFNDDGSATVICGNSTAIKLVDISTNGKTIIKPKKILKIGDRLE